MSDPFQLVFDELWKMATANRRFTEKVRLGNRINYGAPHDKTIEKKNVAEADLPEVVLESTGGIANMWSNSSSSMCIRNYSWNITTGDLRINQRLHPVEWAIFVAMHGWKEKLTALEYGRHNGNPWRFVKRANFIDITAGKIRPEPDQQVARGWAAIWSIEVEFHFPLALIQEEL